MCSLNTSKNLRILGSVAPGADVEGRDLDIRVGSTSAIPLFDIGVIRHEWLQRLGVPVDVLTPNALPDGLRAGVTESCLLSVRAHLAAQNADRVARLTPRSCLPALDARESEAPRLAAHRRPPAAGERAPRARTATRHACAARPAVVRPRRTATSPTTRGRSDLSACPSRHPLSASDGPTVMSTDTARDGPPLRASTAPSGSHVHSRNRQRVLGSGRWNQLGSGCAQIN